MNSVIEGANRTDNDLVIHNTRGEGDCAFHAIFGQWDGQAYVCDNVLVYRSRLAQAVIVSQPGDALYALVRSGLEALMMGAERIKTPAILQLRKEYHDYISYNFVMTEEAWSDFAEKLQRNHHILEYLHHFTAIHSQKKLLSLKDKFMFCLGEDDGLLRAMFSSISELECAFMALNQVVQQRFDVNHKITATLVHEYADYLQHCGNYLLPLELSMIASVFHITVQFYSKTTSNMTLIDTYGPASTKPVMVRFNGVNHYERLVSTLSPISVWCGDVSEHTMLGYRLTQYRRYHDTLVSEFFLQLTNVIEVSRGRSPHQKRFKEKTVTLMCSLVQSFGGTIGSVTGRVANLGIGLFGELEEKKRVALLTPEHLSKQWGSLRKMANDTAKEAVERYRHYLAGCCEEDATELGRVSAQRIWEYLSRTGLSFSIENMLMGILKGESGYLQDGLRNSELHTLYHTAEGVLQRSSLVYQDGNGKWQYAFHPKNKDKYGFMLLPNAQAKALIAEKKYQLVALHSVELQKIWESGVNGHIIEDAVLTELKLKESEQNWCDVRVWQEIIDVKVERLIQKSDQTQTELAEAKTALVTLQVINRAHTKRLDFLEQRYISIPTNNSWSHFAYPRDTSFQKRPQLWSVLETRFAASPSSSVVLSGPGGVGKTSLASEWAHTQKASNRYANVRWLAMDTVQQFDSLEKWAKELQPLYQGKMLSEHWELIAGHIRTQSWLLVLDNVASYAEIQEGLSYFSLTEQQAILITSRNAISWNYPICVDVYSQEEAVSYIEQQMVAVERRGFEELAAQNLAECLSYHPLALELAMAQICSSVEPEPLQSYQACLASQGLVLLDKHAPAMQSLAHLNTYQTLSALWDNILPKFSQDALALLRFLSFISAQGSTYNLLLVFFGGDGDRLNQAIRMLREQSLIKQVDLMEVKNHLDAWSVHRLLQDVVRERVVQEFANDQTRWQDFLTRTWKVIEKTFPEDICTAEDIDVISQCVSHGYAFLKHMDTIAKCWPVVEISENFLLPWQANLLFWIGCGEIDIVHYAVAIENLHKALIIYRQIYGSNSNRTEIADTLSHLGKAYQAKGDNVKAIGFFEESLAICRLVYNEEHEYPKIARTLNGLGILYQAQSDNKKAIKCFEESLDLCSYVDSKKQYHPKLVGIIIAGALNNLGVAYEAESDTIPAIKFYEESLEVKYMVYAGTPNHPEIARTLSNLSVAYLDRGDYIRAIKFLEESLDKRRHVFIRTPNHPGIAGTLCSLGIAHLGIAAQLSSLGMAQAQNNNMKAIALFEESLAMCRIIYASTPNPLAIARIQYHLGIAYHAQNNTMQAIKFLEESLAVYRSVFTTTPNHPEIARTLRSLANISSSSYLQQYKGSFFHIWGCHKISRLQATISSNPNLSSTELTELVCKATANGPERKKCFANII